MNLSKSKNTITSVFGLDRSKQLIILATLCAMHILAVVIMTYTNNHLNRKRALYCKVREEMLPFGLPGNDRASVRKNTYLNVSN